MPNLPNKYPLSLKTRLPEAMHLFEQFYLFLVKSNKLNNYCDELVAIQAAKQLLTSKLNIGGLSVFCCYKLNPVFTAKNNNLTDKLVNSDSFHENSVPAHVIYIESLNSILTFDANPVLPFKPALVRLDLLDLIGDSNWLLSGEVSEFIDCSDLLKEFEQYINSNFSETVPQPLASISEFAKSSPIPEVTSLTALKINSLKYGDIFDLIADAAIKHLKPEKLPVYNLPNNSFSLKNKKLFDELTKEFIPLFEALTNSFKARLKPVYSDFEILKLKADPAEWCHLFAQSVVLAMIFCLNHKIIQKIAKEENFDLTELYLAPYDAPLFVDHMIQTIYAKCPPAENKALFSLFEHLAIFNALEYNTNLITQQLEAK